MYIKVLFFNNYMAFRCNTGPIAEVDEMDEILRKHAPAYWAITKEKEERRKKGRKTWSCDIPSQKELLGYLDMKFCENMHDNQDLIPQKHATQITKAKAMSFFMCAFRCSPTGELGHFLFIQKQYIRLEYESVNYRHGDLEFDVILPYLIEIFQHQYVIGPDKELLVELYKDYQRGDFRVVFLILKAMKNYYEDFL